MIGTTEWIIIAVVVLILFGSAAIPRFARSLGKAKSEFEKGVREGRDEGEKKNRPQNPRRKPAGRAQKS